jgi:hypothetical protein
LYTSSIRVAANEQVKDVFILGGVPPRVECSCQSLFIVDKRASGVEQALTIGTWVRWEKVLDLLAKVAYARRGWKNTESVFVDIATRDVARWDFYSDRNVARWLGGRHGLAV